MESKARSGSTILIGEDEAEVRSYLEMALRCHGYGVQIAEDGEEVLNLLQCDRGEYCAVLLDIMMPRKDGIETLREIRRMNGDLPVIMVSGACSPLHVVEAMKNGATDFLGKPVSHEDLRKSIWKALEKGLGVEPAPVPAAAGQTKHAFFGSHRMMREIQTCIPRIAASDVPVLIQGETGCGKEVLARELHARSRRSSGTFVKLNCAALPSELVESELFGYERGAFTGASQRKPGMFELADGGTIFLDEIGDMDFKLQAKLLQVLQDHEFQRLGGKETIRVDVRVISATHRDLDKAIEDGTFRQDLLYRLNIITLALPPLRDRKDDILPLTEVLMRKHAMTGEAPPAITPALRESFLNYPWPGNIRELENVVQKLLLLRHPDTLATELNTRRLKRKPGREEPAETTPPEVQLPQPILEQVSRAKAQAETEAILAALDASRWNRKQAAAMLNIDYKALLYKMKKLGIEKMPAPPLPSSLAHLREGEMPKVRAASASASPFEG